MGLPAAAALAAAGALALPLAALLAGRGGEVPLLGLGVDAEQAGRFDGHAAEGFWRRSVWTRRELDHAAGRTDRSRVLCASFCCKEAVYKAAGGRIRFNDVELLAPGGPATLAVALAPGSAPPGVAGASARVEEAGGPDGEVVVIAALHGSPPPAPGGWPWPTVIESLKIAEAESRREELLARDFGEGERRDLARRHPQTIAGRVAAKRALVRALAGAGIEVAPARVVIAGAAREAPRLSAPLLPEGRVLLFSISHTRRNAYAVAALSSAPRP